MISYGKQTLDQSDIDEIVKVLRGDWLSSGPAVKVFEDDLCNYFGADFGCVVSSGTAALHLTGMALNWQEEDIVITSPLTFLATANSIVYSKAIPSFVDINPRTYTLDLNKVEEKISYYRKKRKNIKAIIGIDFAGHPCDWKGLRYLADKYDLSLVNDNCHAMGAEYHSSKEYAVQYADIVTHSYHPVKHITTGEGGAILTNNKRIDERVKRLRNHGMTKDQKQLTKIDGPWYYEMPELGLNYRLTDFQSALGSSQLSKLDNFIKRRREIAKYYNDLFVNENILTTPLIKDEVSHAYHLYPLLINFDKIKIDKKIFFKKMIEKNISLQVHYIPLHLQPYYQKNYGYKNGDFPISENYYKCEVSLPIYPRLSNEEVALVATEIKNIINR